MYRSDDIAALLSPALGEEAAQDRVGTAVALEGKVGRSMTKPEALAVLERIAAEDGMVGTVARFAKTRLLLAA